MTLRARRAWRVAVAAACGVAARTSLSDAQAAGAAGAAGCATRSAAAPTSSDTLYDVVIRNGCVLDGKGNPTVFADVAIKDGRFVKIGKITARGRTEIDAAGKYVSPGWIDMMDQSGGVLPRNGLAENKLREGVTTAIGGEGGTPVPAGRVAEYFDNTRAAGNQHQLRQLLQRDAGARRRVGDVGAQAERGRAGSHARDHGYRHVGRRDGDDDGADLSAVELLDHRRIGGGRESGRQIRRHVREPHARRRAGRDRRDQRARHDQRESGASRPRSSISRSRTSRGGVS